MAGSLVEFDEKGDGLARYRYVVKKYRFKNLSAYGN